MSRPELLEKLAKVMALMESPNENEAAAAAAHLARLLETHNLEMADLEAAGQEAPKVERGDDVKLSENPLNDPTVKWKVHLGEAVAEHFYCYALTSYDDDRIQFIGRRENLDSLELLYEWFIKQIKRLAKSERRVHLERTGEDVPGIRWQMAFAEGCINRLRERLYDERERHATKQSTGLVVSHSGEINDFMEEDMGYRRDGRKTKRQAQREQDYKDLIATKAELLASNPAEYYRQYPSEHPDRVAEQELQDAAREKRRAAKQRRNDGRRRRYREAKDGLRDLAGVDAGTFGGDHYGPATDWVAEDQKDAAEAAGYRKGDDVNLQPHLDGGNPNRKGLKEGS